MPDSPDVPAWMQRAVWERDGGRCAFVGKNGRRCNSTWCLQYHHVIARAQGGLTTVENLQLRCAAHNRYEADLAYGPANRLKYAGTVSEARVTYRAGPPIRAGASSGPACAYINKVGVVTPPELSQAPSDVSTRAGASRSVRVGPLVDHFPAPIIAITCPCNSPAGPT
jgi:hypothetical protein